MLQYNTDYGKLIKNLKSLFAISRYHNTVFVSISVHSRKGSQMKRNLKRIPALILVFLFVIALLPGLPITASAESYTPRYHTVKVGLFYGGSALSASNLENVSGYGSGYRFGYYNSDRKFQSFGAVTDETAISVLRDVNMYYDSSSNRYYAGTSGSVVVGCFHIQLETAYTSYLSAQNAADTFTSAQGFVKYSYGDYYVCVGDYTSEEAARTAAESMSIAQGYSITSGSSYTMCVVATGTDRILLEFEHGTDRWLGVEPRSTDGGKTLTWTRGYKYYGGFQFGRFAGGDITVVNLVDIDDYVKGVLPYEMNASWPVEALKAQALSARTYAAANFNKHSGFDVCCTDDCQVYRGMNSSGYNSEIAAEETAGEYLLYKGELATTYYMSCDGGATENSENVWFAALGYLRGVEDPYEDIIADSISGYYWSRSYTNEELTYDLQSNGYSIGEVVKFEVSEYTGTGNVYKITFTDSDGRTVSFSKERVRLYFGFPSIRYNITPVGGSGGGDSSSVYAISSSTTASGDLSSSYAIGSSGGASPIPSGTVYAIGSGGSVEEVGSSSSAGGADSYRINGSGMGHNVGMSQWGAYSMAKYYDKTYDEILKFYFTDITIAY